MEKHIMEKCFTGNKDLPKTVYIWNFEGLLGTD